MKRIYDQNFRYTPAVATDVRKTFERARKRLAAEAANQAEAQQKVKPLVGKVRKQA